MEGAGGSTRMGSRSSTRHGPASVFHGPVRRWRKSWVPVPTTSPSATSSRVLLYKWSPAAASVSGVKEAGTEESVPKSLQFLSVSVILAQKEEEAARKAAEEAEAAAQAQDEDQKGMEITELDANLSEASAQDTKEAGVDASANTGSGQEEGVEEMASQDPSLDGKHDPAVDQVAISFDEPRDQDQASKMEGDGTTFEADLQEQEDIQQATDSAPMDMEGL